MQRAGLTVIAEIGFILVKNGRHLPDGVKQMNKIIE